MRRRLLVRGSRVQDIGYRMFLLNLASEHGLTGFQARNVDRDGVEALYEGEEEAVANFERDVEQMAPEGAEIESIRFEDYEGPVMNLEGFRSSFTTLQLGKIIEVGLAMLQKQDLMLQKQDETVRELRAFREESSANQRAMLQKQDLMLQKQDETVRELRELGADLRSILSERLRRLEEDVALIKAKLGIE